MRHRCRLDGRSSTDRVRTRSAISSRSNRSRSQAPFCLRGRTDTSRPEPGIQLCRLTTGKADVERGPSPSLSAGRAHRLCKLFSDIRRCARHGHAAKDTTASATRNHRENTRIIVGMDPSRRSSLGRLSFFRAASTDCLTCLHDSTRESFVAGFGRSVWTRACTEPIRCGVRRHP
jgi:hypothetical protein